MQTAEIYRYVSAIVGWDEFLAGGFEAVSDRQLAESAAAAAEHCAEYDSGTHGDAASLPPTAGPTASASSPDQRLEATTQRA
jgi:hypothetical protein